MKKFASALLAMLMACSVSFAADRSIGVSPELVVPVGDLADAAELGFGLSVRYQQKFNDKIDWGVNAGYLMFGEKGISTTSIIPIEAVATYAVTKCIYAGVNLGVALWSTEVDFLGTTVTGDDTKLSLSPMVGYLYKINDKMMLDVSARMNVLPTDGMYLGVRVGINYGM
jgi:outer membrane protein with beta-barrel domain